MQYDFSESEFQEAYHKIVAEIRKAHVPQEKKCVIFLGGQPGAGKSYFYTQDGSLCNYVFVNGDAYRTYHPHFQEIVEQDLASMPELTQRFSNRCVEELIRELSDEGYNLIIEGTLRDPDITTGTCLELKAKGYETGLYVMAADAVLSWEATVNRAKMIYEMGEVPRVVPLDKYDYIVKHLAENIRKIEERKCFDFIRVVNRDNLVLYPCRGKLSASEALSGVLQLERWNREYPEKEQEFGQIQERITGQQRRRQRHGR